MKNLGIFGSEFFFFALTSLGKSRQSISSCISLALSIIDSEMVLGKFLSPADLPRTQAFSIHELAEIVVIGKLKNLISVALQVVAPSLKGFNYSQQFLIVRFVPSLRRNHFSREKRYGMPLTRLRG